MSSRNLDAYVRGRTTACPNLLVPHYLIHSYLYYELDKAVISDTLYEELCIALDRQWDQVVHHHKRLIDRSSLAAGTGYYLKYPVRVQQAARSLLAELHKGKPKRA